MSVVPVSKKSDRTIRVTVTAGSIRSGDVSVRENLHFFPKAAMSRERLDRQVPEPCLLEIDGVGIIETEIDTKRGVFRWRGWKRFFKQHHVSDGDMLVFAKTAPSHFSVTVEHKVLDGLERDSAAFGPRATRPSRTRTLRRGNDLSGDEWLRYSLSIWSDIRKTPEEASLKHPAMFPTMLCERLILMFLRRRGLHRILDPFMGSGSTLVAARNMGKIGIGLEINPSYIEMAKRRLQDGNLFGQSAPDFQIYNADARILPKEIALNSIDLCITSPPYWDILNQARTADYKAIRHYGNLDRDLGTIGDYDRFLDELRDAFWQVFQALKPGAYCAVVVMDLRKKDRFYAFHSDFAERLIRLGFVFDDLIIWDRGREYNNLRPLGYPAVFRINKIHEFVLLFQKPGGRT